MRNLLAGVFSVVVFGNYLWRFDNLFRVDEDLSRSAQLSPKRLRKIIDSFGVKTVVNLRGEHVGTKWYDDEKRICDEMGVDLRDIKLTASRLPKQEELDSIISTLCNMKYPAHVHCMGGAERTGLFCGFYEIINTGNVDEALKQVGWKYGVVQPYQRKFFRNLQL